MQKCVGLYRLIIKTYLYSEFISVIHIEVKENKLHSLSYVTVRRT